MKDINLIKAGLYLLFNEYRHNSLPDDEFVKRIKTLCKGKGDKNFWWRFFSDDTRANDYMSVSSSLRSPKNRVYLNGEIDISLEQKSLIVFYS